MERKLSVGAFRHMLRSFVDELMFLGRNEAETELYEEVITGPVVGEVLAEIGKIENESAKQLREEIESRDPDDRRLALCGFFFDSEDWPGSAEEAAQDLVDAAKWFRRSHKRLVKFPKLFLADYERIAANAEWRDRADHGDVGAKWFAENDKTAGYGPMCASARVLLDSALARYAGRNMVAAPSFRKDLFEPALEKQIERGNGYALMLQARYRELADDMARANMVTALFELAMVDLLSESVDVYDYEMAVEAVLHYFKGLDVIGAHCPQALAFVG